MSKSNVTTTPTRVVGNQLPAFLLGRPRSFWTDVMAPKRRLAVVADFEGPTFDVSEILADLEYRGVTGAQAA